MDAKGITPILNVSDFKASVEWFERLGWEFSWGWGDPHGFGGVCSGECQIFLCQDGQGGRGRGTNTKTFGESESADKGVWMSIWVETVETVDELHGHCLANDIEVTFPPTDMEWNVREMHVRHPDGHVFRISCGLGS